MWLQKFALTFQHQKFNTTKVTQILLTTKFHNYDTQRNEELRSKFKPQDLQSDVLLWHLDDTRSDSSRERCRGNF